MIGAGIGALWCAVEPTLPWALICIFAVVLDCISAARLNHRIKVAHPEGGAVGKFQSRHAMKMISTLSMVFGCIILAQTVDALILDFMQLHLGNYVAAIFCLVTGVSILENESSCNGSSWAKVAQKMLVDKTKRHLEVELVNENENEPQVRE